MTLIVGLKCDGGIVLGADTLEETSTVKYSAEKLITYKSDWCQVGFVGSGENSDIIDTVVDRVIDFLDAHKPDNFSEIKRVVGEALTEVYSNVIDFYPQPPPPADPVDTRVVLLLAVHGSTDSKAKLLASDSNALHPVQSNYDIRGMGEIVRFEAKRLFRKDSSLGRGVLLCAYLLGLSKGNVTSVGGESHIAVLTNEGWLHEERIDETTLTEQAFEQLNKDLATLFLSYADPSVTENEFKGLIESFAEDSSNARSEYVTRFEDLHLGIAETDPKFKEPYQKLTEGVRRVFNGIAYRYKTSHGSSGKSGYSGYLSASPTYSPSGSYSVSASSSMSPSSSASPSEGDEPEDNAVAKAVEVVDKAIKEKGKP